jgi:enoyl-CoA hydratase/carnithine racemase
MTYETLIVERRGPVGWLIFNRPESLNAHNIPMLQEVPQAWTELDEDDAVRVIVITGLGRGFSVGADVKEIAATGGGMGERMKKMDDPGEHNGKPARRGLGPRAAGVWKPVITAVNGVCAGGGLHFVCDADIVLAASTAFFVDTHVTVGQVAALEPIGLVGRMPFGAIMRMALVGSYERISAERAYELGMVDQVVEPDRLQDEAQALAEKIARNSPSALMATKRAVWNALEKGRSAALADGMDYVTGFWDHPDNREGPAAFAEKREPVWAPPTRDV